MPVSYIKKLAREGKGTEEELEKKWSQAKAITISKFGTVEGKYGYLVSTFQRLAGLKQEKEGFIAKVKRYLGRTKTNKDLSPEIRKRLWKRSRQRSRKRRRKRRR